MNNPNILKLLSLSYREYLNTSSRSNKKLIILHGGIAEDLAEKFSTDYTIHSLGYMDSKEKTIQGRYINKRVDIVITKGDTTVAGIGVKFVMNNYSQNSNNYFENMLGETANIRCSKLPYFQILIIPHQMPYFDDKGKITKWETFSEHNAEKYFKLSEDDHDLYLHSPNKTLIYLINLPEVDPQTIQDKKQYKEFMKNIDPLTITTINPFDSQKIKSGIILNDYETFSDKLYHFVMSL